MRASSAIREALLGSLLALAVLAAPSACAAGAALGTARGVGAVELSLDDGRIWLPLGGTSLPIMDGTQLRATTGSALLDLTDGSQLRLLAFTSARFSNTGEGIEASVRYGRLSFRLPARTRLALRTPSARVGALRPQVIAGELAVGTDGATALRMTEGQGRVEALAGEPRTLIAGREPVFLPDRPENAGSLFAAESRTSVPRRGKAVFSPTGESLGYLRPDAQLVLHPGYTAALTRALPEKLVRVAMAQIPEASRQDALPVFDVNGLYLGYVAGPRFYAQAAVTPGATGVVEVLLARAPAEATPRGQTVARALVRGARLAEGDRVRTGQGGATEIRLGDGSLVRLGELSDFEVERLDVDSAGAPRSSRFHLATGQVRAWVARQLVAKVATAQGEFTIRTPTAIAAVRQTDFAVVFGSPSRVYTFDGAVETTGQAGPGVVCTSNQYTVVQPGGGAEPCRAIPLLDKLRLQQNLAFESTPITPDNLRASLSVDLTAIGATAAILGGVGGAGAAGAFDGREATALRPVR